MDMDMVIDFEDPAPQDYPQIQIEIDTPQQEASPPLNAGDAVPNKIYIRGLDDLTTENITSYSLEHFPIHTPVVEWIDGDNHPDRSPSMSMLIVA